MRAALWARRRCAVSSRPRLRRAESNGELDNVIRRQSQARSDAPRLSRTRAQRKPLLSSAQPSRAQTSHSRMPVSVAPQTQPPQGLKPQPVVPMLIFCWPMAAPFCPPTGTVGDCSARSLSGARESGRSSTSFSVSEGDRPEQR